MPRLLLLRHAQAVDVLPGHPDADRPLTEHGHDQARRAGRALAERGYAVDLALCSAAERTRQTLDDLGLACPAEYREAIYHASSDAIAAEIAAVDDYVETLLVVGHAPGVPSLVHELSGEDADPQAAAAIRRHFPTATWCAIEVTGGWADFANGRPTGRLREAFLAG